LFKPSETASTAKASVARASPDRRRCGFGLVAGGKQTAVCVEVFRETILFKDARDLWVFTFRDGRVASGLRQPARPPRL
jgi:hypothetical protein